MTLKQLVLLVSLPGWLAPLAAQQPVNAIPTDQQPIGKVFPPAEADRCEKGTGKFVIFTREKVGKENEWDFIAGAWECIPSRPNVPVTKRVEFCHSSWAPDLLLNVLANDGEGEFPRFVRLWVDDAADERYTNLYDIDYRRWEVKCIWQGEDLDTFGVSGGKIYAQGDDDQWLLIDSSDGKIRANAPFEPVGGRGDFWLVRKPGEKSDSGCWTYDRQREKFIAHFNRVEWSRLGFASWRLSDDGTSRAWVVAPDMLEWEGGEFDAKLIVQRKGQEKDISVPVVMNARPGSGVRVRPTGVTFSFTDDGAVELRVRNPDDQKEVRFWRVELKDGVVTSGTAAHAPAEPGLSGDETFHGVPVVEYLRKSTEEFRHFGRGGLAPAFLMSQGILKKKPEYPDCHAGVSPDGRHVIYRATDGPLAGKFIYGDLETKKIVQWDAPAGLPKWTVLDFAWVVTP